MTQDGWPGHRLDDDEVASQAARWVARYDLGTVNQAAFLRWRDTDVRHAIAFNRALATIERFDRDIDAPAPPMEPDASPHLRSRRGVLLSAGRGLAVALVATGGLAGRAYAWSSASTAIGESRKLRLPDGSIAALNTDSRLAWRFSQYERSLWVERGEIAIDLDPGVTATMHGADRSVALAQGRFNARLRGGTLDLMVLRGEALVGDRAITGRHSLLLSDDDPAIRAVSPSQMEAAIAWQHGEILFDEATLGTAVEEYNRFLARKIVIVDPDLATIPVGGRFTSNDPSAFLRAITTGLGVHVSVSETAYLLTR